MLILEGYPVEVSKLRLKATAGYNFPPLSLPFPTGFAPFAWCVRDVGPRCLVRLVGGKCAGRSGRAAPGLQNLVRYVLVT